MEPGDVGDQGSGRGVRRWGPLVAILAIVVVIVAVIALTSGGGDDEADSEEGPGATSDATTETSDGTVALPEGVLPFSVAEAEGIEVAWPDTCDTETGSVAIPSLLAGECYAPYDGPQGGESDQGVTDDSIKIVLYQASEGDEIYEAIAGAASDDTNVQTVETHEGFLELYEDYYETYGRSIELIPFEGSGGYFDPVAARADAAEIAAMEPFQVWGSPGVNDFVDELAGSGIQTVQLLHGQPNEYYVENDPFVFSIGMSPLQNRSHTAEYIGKRLAGEPAEHAGDPALQSQERVFGYVALDTEVDAASTATRAEFERMLGEHGTSFAEVLTYTDPITLQSSVPGLIGRLKEAGVTTVVFTGDPLAPGFLTREATNQDYFPEWIVDGSVLVDTTAFARTYDQEQWANAFGVSTGAARVEREAAGYYRTYDWYHCAPPAAEDSVGLIGPYPATFYSAIQALGPDLTREGFRDALFAADPTPQGVTIPSLSWGDKDRWPFDDYHGVDDATEIWWDAAATGEAETGNEGVGMYRYVDGGARHLPGEWPDSPPDVFVAEGTVTIYDETPADEPTPDYPRPCE